MHCYWEWSSYPGLKRTTQIVGRLSWARENSEAIASAFSDFVMRVSPPSFKDGIPWNLSLIILFKPLKDIWPGLKARSLLPKKISLRPPYILLRTPNSTLSSVLWCLCQARQRSFSCAIIDLIWGVRVRWTMGGNAVDRPCLEKNSNSSENLVV
jgi:hypothetical protein